jgi:hypothetical protein
MYLHRREGDFYEDDNDQDDLDNVNEVLHEHVHVYGYDDDDADVYYLNNYADGSEYIKQNHNNIVSLEK